MVDSDDNNLCFKFWNFTIKLFHILGFTEELVFGSSTSVTRLHLFFVCFIGGSHFFKEPAGIVHHAGCILLELKIIIFSSYTLFCRVTEFALLLRQIFKICE